MIDTVKYKNYLITNHINRFLYRVAVNRSKRSRRIGQNLSGILGATNPVHLYGQLSSAFKIIITSKIL